MLKTNNNINNEEILKTYLELATSDINKNYIDLNTKIEGLSIKEAKKRLNENGKNVTIKEEKRGPIYFFINSLKDEFVLILIFLSIINFLLGDKLGSMIIFAISIISAGVRFVQDYSIYKFNQKLKRSVISKCLVVRNNKELEINVTDVVVGDIVKLTAGSIIPADLKLIETKDLFINQSVYTGESILVEKLNKYQDTDNPDLFNLSNIALMSTSVVSGLGTGLVIKTGLNTYLGKVGKKVKFSKNDTNFDKGIKSISHLLLKYMIIVCIFVVIVDGIIKQNFNEALLFALSVAVGITPSMLPMIVNVNLAKGSKRLAAKKTLVKNIASIQNLGSIDILCTDKTGTLTENRIVLQEYIDANGKANMNVLKYAYLNSTYSTGIKNLVDKAILNYGKLHGIDKKIEKYEKIDEIPFDYTRKRQSVVVKNKNSYLMITKGALEEIISNCKWVLEKGSKSKLNKEKIDNIKEQATAMASNGMQVIALAIKDTYPGSNKFNISFKECNNTDILNDVMMNGYNLGIIRVPADLEAKYKKMLTSKQMQFKEIWNFNYNVVFSKNHPLAGKDKLCFNDLKEYSVLLHDDEYVPFISKEEIKKLTPSYDSSSKILIQERGSQFDILSRLAKTYMWVTPIPQTLLDNHKLIMKKCIDNKQSFVDILIYPKNYSLSEFEKKFIENIFEIKYALENGENAD